MQSEARSTFNAAFTEGKYQQMLTAHNELYGFPPKFRVAETPVFIPKILTQRLIQAGNEMVEYLLDPEFMTRLESAVPPHLNVPNETSHPHFLSIDFAITKTEDGELMPQLIELQAFPAIGGFFIDFVRGYRKFFPIPDWPTYFSGLDEAGYIQRTKNLLLNGHKARHVVLLETKPETQHTNIDFWATERYFGIKTVCISKVVREGRKLFYRDGDEWIRIKRIFNRVILDDLYRQTDRPYAFNMTEDVDVEWCGHPNWFMKVSKYCMPFIKSEYNPDCRLLSELDTFPADLENYVLKPLFSFSSAGVVFHVTQKDLDAIPKADYANWMLQRKIT